MVFHDPLSLLPAPRSSPPTMRANKEGSSHTRYDSTKSAEIFLTIGFSDVMSLPLGVGQF